MPGVWSETPRIIIGQAIRLAVNQPWLSQQAGPAAAMAVGKQIRVRVLSLGAGPGHAHPVDSRHRFCIVSFDSVLRRASDDSSEAERVCCVLSDRCSLPHIFARTCMRVLTHSLIDPARMIQSLIAKACGDIRDQCKHDIAYDDSCKSDR